MSTSVSPLAVHPVGKEMTLDSGKGAQKSSSLAGNDVNVSFIYYSIYLLYKHILLKLVR